MRELLRPANGQHASLRLRLLAGTLAWILATIAIAGWGLGGLFKQHIERQLRAELLIHLDQITAALIDDEDPPHLSSPLSDPRFTRPYSGLYWQVDRLPTRTSADTGVLRSRSLWDSVLSMPEQAPHPGESPIYRIDGPNGQSLRALERSIRPAETSAAWRLIVAADETLLSEPVQRFTGQLLAALLLLAIGLVAAAVVQVLVGLRPLAGLRKALARVREGHSSAIEGHFPAELQPLIEEFNGTLAANAEIVERARTQAGNLAHAIKTPLSVLANAAAGEDSQLARLVRDQVTVARTQVDHHLARARAAAAIRLPGQRTALQPVLAGLLRVMERIHAERRLTLKLAPFPPGLAFRGETQDLQEMLGNLLDNACKWAASQVAIEVESRHGELNITITDDGPGLPEDALDAALARGVRIDEQTPGSGLGLAIVRDLAQFYGGAIGLHRAASGGLRAELRLPAA